MQRLGKNISGYFGEVIDIEAVLVQVGVLAAQAQWQLTSLPVSADLGLITLQRMPELPRRRIYISTGIHGDEPAGPLAMLRLLKENKWPADYAFYLCPCLNPRGFKINQRLNEAGIDLNRDYRHRRAASVRAHIEWLATLPSFDLALCLHEDWESEGFYLYEVNPDGLPSLAEAIIRQVSAVCPVDASPMIEGREAKGGIIRPQLDPVHRPEWPEMLYLIQNKTRLGYTLEAPSDYPLSTRVDALCAGVQAALQAEQ
jgi:predicted deacylase